MNFIMIKCNLCSSLMERDAPNPLLPLEQRQYISFNNDIEHLCIACAKATTFYQYAEINKRRKEENKKRTIKI